MLSGHEGLFSLDSHSDKRLEGPWLPVCCQPGLTCPRDAGLALAPSSQRARQEIMIINGRPLFLVLDNKGQAGEMVGGWRKGKKKQEVVGEGKEMIEKTKQLLPDEKGISEPCIWETRSWW